jgi:protein involved in polysaccharide export with SLBB domain
MISIFKNIKNIKRTFFIIIHIIFILHIESNIRTVFAQKSSYKIQVEDLIEISFWESPNMDRKVQVSNDGNIVIPVIGSVKAAGLTVDGLAQEIITQMGMYNKIINQVNINILEFGQNKVHVTGQVTSPGKYSFEEMPNLWDIILEAGGPLEDAQLDGVLIVRSQEDGQIITVDVAYALKRGKMNELPKVDPGDAIHIPGVSSPFGVTVGRTTEFASRNEFYIVGAIGTPGIQQYENNLNILDAIGRAGGPTAEANIEEVKYIAVHSKGTKVWDIDLEFYINNSLSIALPDVTPGSTIYIPREPQMSPVLQAILVSTISTALTTITVIYVTDALR